MSFSYSDILSIHLESEKQQLVQSFQGYNLTRLALAVRIFAKCEFVSGKMRKQIQRISQILLNVFRLRLLATISFAKENLIMRKKYFAVSQLVRKKILA